MKIKDAIYDEGCPKCGAGKKLIKDEVFGCDLCKKEISSPYDNNRTYLEITVFYVDNRPAYNLHFCSWHCVFEFMKKIQTTEYKCDYFVDLPHVIFNEKTLGYNDFIKAIFLEKSP